MMTRVTTDRIIVDVLQKEDKLRFENPWCQAMCDIYTLLDQTGILKSVCFKYEIINGQVQFALDAKKLYPFRNLMLSSGIECAENAVELIFDYDISPCEYCGAISLLYPMLTYRNTTGSDEVVCVSRGWECCRCESRHYGVVVAISEEMRQRNWTRVQEIVEKYWDKF